MNAKYDFHIHSVLSPCGDEDMTPNNLVNMAALQGYDVIALTDHNSCLNCEAAMKVGEQAGVLVIPGMELQTAEDVHLVCLLPDLERALRLSKLVHEAMPPIRNRPDVFGPQRILDENDEQVGEEEILLVNSCRYSILEAVRLVRDLGGACFPAHIDKQSFSILASLGEIPPEAGFTAAEVSARGDVPALLKAHPILKDMRILRDSDAHYLEQMPEAKPVVPVPRLTAEEIIAIINQKPQE